MRKYEQTKIIKIISDLCELSPDEYRDTFRSPEKDFTRKRKQALGAIVKTGILNAGSCLNSQLRQCYGMGERPTASAYIQQRDKLTSSFYRRLFDERSSHIDRHSSYRGKYVIVACDGSGINISPDKDDNATRIVHTSHPEDEKPCNQVHLNVLCTVPDGYFIDYEIQDFMRQNEVSACADMMKRLPGKGSMGGLAPIICCDRGYESYYLMVLAQSLGLRYCIRLKDIGSGGISGAYADMCDEDGCFDIISDKKYTYSSFVLNDRDRYSDYVVCAKSSANPFIPPVSNRRGRPRRHEKRDEPSYYRFSFRILRFRLPGGGFEVLATNLPKDAFPVKRMMELYHLRWGIETAFRQLKYNDGASYIHSRKKDAAIGEIILSLIFHNICSLVLMILGDKIRNRWKNRRHAYRISYSDLSSAMRIFIAGRDPTASVNRIVRELLITSHPIRNDRAFSRQLNRHPFVPFIYRAA